VWALFLILAQWETGLNHLWGIIVGRRIKEKPNKACAVI